MKRTILLILLISPIIVFGQQRGNWGGNRGGGQQKVQGKITGTITDETSGAAVEFATLVLKDPKTKKDVTGGISDESGEFKLYAPVGTYELQIFFIGYDQLNVPIKMTPQSPDVSLGKVKMKSNSTELEEVVIEGEKELVESKIDKLVYNAERDVANAGGNAADVLRRAPLLSVDLDGNVSLRGSQNIQILINGKPSSMMASSPADILSVLPADEIKSVEVITTPSAKYDGEGSAGIINIITKKKKLEGISGNINTSVGTRQNNLRMGLNTGKGRFGFNMNGGSYFSWPREGTSDFERLDQVEGQTRSFTENGASDSYRLGFYGSGGAFYDFNAYRSINSTFRIRGFNSGNDGSYVTRYNDPINSVNQNYIRYTDNTRLNSGFEWNIDYTNKFAGSPGREFTVSYKLDGNVSNNESLIQQEDLIGSDIELFRDEINDNESDNRENTFQIDYTHPFGKLVTIETGAKMVLRSVISDYQFDTLDQANNVYVSDSRGTDVFTYNQDVTAGYFSSNWKFGENYGLVAGVRYERTEFDGRFDEISNDFADGYENFLPSIIFSRKLPKFRTLKLSYTRRIQRPGLRYLNPYTQLDNNRNVSLGNPEILPELTDQFEINYNTFIKKSVVNLSVYYRNTTDVIENFLDVNDEGVSVTTFRNIGKRNSVGSNLFLSTKLFKIWTIRGGLNVFTYDASGVVDGVALSNNAVLFSGNLNTNITFKNDWVIDAGGFFQGRRQTLQGYNQAFRIFYMGMRKQIWDKKGSIGLRIVEPFVVNKKFRSELVGENYTQTSVRAIPFQSFGINFSYRFGKFKSSGQRRSKIKNDDQGSGGDDRSQGF